ncbi:MAG: hypothetical protein ACRC1N_11990, partial [Aeromonas sobria]
DEPIATPALAQDGKLGLGDQTVSPSGTHTGALFYQKTAYWVLYLTLRTGATKKGAWRAFLFTSN